MAGLRMEDQRRVIEISSDDDDDDERLVASLRPPPTARSANVRHPHDLYVHRQRNTKPRRHRSRTGTSEFPKLLSDSDDVSPRLDRKGNKRIKRELEAPVRPAGLLNLHRHVSPSQIDRNHHRPRLGIDEPDNHVVASMLNVIDDDETPEDAGPSNTEQREAIPEEPRQPWFFDVKFDTAMYSGPGYERFPVALGTVKGHSELCDEFRNRRHARVQAHTSCTSAAGQKFEDRALRQVLEVFPNISHEFVGRQCAMIAQQNPQLSPQQLPVEAVLNKILELDEYPREPKKKETTEQAAADGTGVTISVKAQARNHHTYLTEGLHLLAWQFPHVPTHYIFKVLHDKANIYDTYLALRAAENRHFQLSTRERPYSRRKDARQQIEKKYVKSTHPRNGDYGHWVNEIQAAKQHLERESIRMDEQEEESRREAENLALHKDNGLLVECQVCFDDEVPINRSVSCKAEEGHLFCFSCIAQLANTQVGQMKYEMKCMHSDGCAADLDPDGVGQAVPLKTVDRLAFNQQQAEIKAAGIEGLEDCPVCDFKAILDPIEDTLVFNCMNPDCGRASCRKCKEEAHVPMTCEEFKNDRGLEARHAVEEARTNAVVRPCAKCKVPIIKEHGCNKMICTQCGCLMCYVCKEDISQKGYDHFNKGDSRCALYDRDTNAMHDAEADAAELEAIKKAKAENSGLDEKKLRIGSGKTKHPQQPEPVDLADFQVPPLEPLLEDVGMFLRPQWEALARGDRERAALIEHYHQLADRERINPQQAALQAEYRHHLANQQRIDAQQAVLEAAAMRRVQNDILVRRQAARANHMAGLQGFHHPQVNHILPAPAPMPGHAMGGAPPDAFELPNPDPLPAVVRQGQRAIDRRAAEMNGPVVRQQFQPPLPPQQQPAPQNPGNMLDRVHGWLWGVDR